MLSDQTGCSPNEIERKWTATELFEWVRYRQYKRQQVEESAMGLQTDGRLVMRKKNANK